MEHKAQYQLAGEEQIVARFMIEQLNFRGIARADDATTCLASYDLTRYPETTGPSFTEYFALGLAFGAAPVTLCREGLECFRPGACLRSASRRDRDPDRLLHRAVEAVLTGACDWLNLGPAHWERAVKESGYVAAQHTVRKTS